MLGTYERDSNKNHIAFCKILGSDALPQPRIMGSKVLFQITLFIIFIKKIKDFD